jgi:hypothetical protein
MAGRNGTVDPVQIAFTDNSEIMTFDEEAA